MALRARQLTDGNIELFGELLPVTGSHLDLVDDACAFFTNDIDKLGGIFLVLVEVLVAPVAAARFDRDLHGDTPRLINGRRAATVGHIDGRG